MPLFKLAEDIRLKDMSDVGRSLRAVSPPKAAARVDPYPPATAAATRERTDPPTPAYEFKRSTSAPVQPTLEAPEDEYDELSLPDSPSREGGRLGIQQTDYGKGHVDHTLFDDKSDYSDLSGRDSLMSVERSSNTQVATADNDNDNDEATPNNYGDDEEFEVDRHPEEFGSEDETSSHNSTPVASPRLSPESSPRNFAERKRMAALGKEDNVMEIVDRLESTVEEMELSGRSSPVRESSKAASFVISISDVELLGAKEISLAYASKVEPTVDPVSLVQAALNDSVRSEESKRIRQRSIDFVTSRRQMGHSTDRMSGQNIHHLDDIMEDVVLTQEIAFDKVELGDYDGAMAEYMSIVTRCEDGTYVFTDERVQDELTGTIMHNIAVIHSQLSMFEICPQLWDETVLTRRDANPELGIFQSSVATSLNEMGIALFACGQYDKAVRAFADVVYITQEIRGINNAYLATAINNIGVAHFAMDDGKALEAFEESLQVYRLAMLAESEEEDNNDDSDVFDGAKHLLLGISTTLCNVAFVRATQGAYAEAREAINEALEIQEAVLDRDDPRVDASWNLLSKIDAFGDEDIDNPPTLGLTPSGMSSFVDDSQVDNPFHTSGDMGRFKESESVSYRNSFDPFGDDASSAAGFSNGGVSQQRQHLQQQTAKPNNLWQGDRKTSF